MILPPSLPPSLPSSSFPPSLPSSSPLLYSLPSPSLPPPLSTPSLRPFKEYARMVQMLQGYCLISTGVRITCHDQSGKGYATTCKIGSFLEKIFFHSLCSSPPLLLLLSSSFSYPFFLFPPPPPPHTSLSSQKQLVVSTGGSSSVKENIINVFGPKQVPSTISIHIWSLQTYLSMRNYKLCGVKTFTNFEVL